MHSSLTPGTKTCPDTVSTSTARTTTPWSTQHTATTFSGNIAVTTAILATVGAIFGYQGGATQNDAALFKNNAAITKTEAANRWNYYQAKSAKQNLAELAMTLPNVDPEKYKADVARYKAEKEDIKKDGVISADVNGLVLNVDPNSSSGLINNGLVQAVGGGILLLNGNGGGRDLNAG